MEGSCGAEAQLCPDLLWWGLQREGTAWELSGLAESCPWLSEITTGLVLALLPAPVSAGTLWVQHPGSKPSLTAFPTCLGQLGQKIPPVSIPAWACVTLCAPETTLQAQGGLVCCQNSWLLFSWSILDARGGLAGMGRAVQEPWTSVWPHFPGLLALSLQAVQQSQHPRVVWGGRDLRAQSVPLLPWAGTLFHSSRMLQAPPAWPWTLLGVRHSLCVGSVSWDRQGWFVALGL